MDPTPEKSQNNPRDSQPSSDANDATAPNAISRPNNIRFRWKGKIVNERIYKHKLALQEAGKRRRLANLAQVEEDPKIPVEGRRIVDLALLAKHLMCDSCKDILSLRDIASETRRGLASILHVRCRNCSEVKCVPTSKSVADKESKGKLYTVNCDVVKGAVQADLTCNRLNKFLTSLDIPPLQWKLFQRYKYELAPNANEADNKEEKKDFSVNEAIEAAETVRNSDEVSKILEDLV